MTTATQRPRSAIANRIAKAATRGNGGSWINPGIGELTVLALKDGTRPEFDDGDTFVAELLVDKCDGIAGMKDKEGNLKPAGNPVGSQVSFVQQFEVKYPSIPLGEVRAFLLNLLGITDADLVADAEKEKARRIAAGEPLEKKSMVDAKTGQTVQLPDDYDAEDEFAELYMDATDRTAKPCRGQRIGYSTTEKTTKETKMILTLPIWKPIAQTPEEVAANRARVDGKTV